MKTLISLLGADIIMKNDAWQSSDLNVRSQDTKSNPSSFRIAAALALLQRDPEAHLLAQGDLQDETHPSIGSVLKKELVELGIAPHRISLEEKSKNTLQQLIELQTFALKEQPKTLKILSNEWHIPRVMAMVECRLELAELNSLAPEYIKAEEVLIACDEELWRPCIDAARLTPEMQKVIDQEAKGTLAIRNGTYQFNNTG